MESTKINKILTSFKNDTRFKSILIDGPWGCGKTYQANEFLKKENNCLYLSLFGLESIEDINISLETERKIKSGEDHSNISLITKFTEVFSRPNRISESLDYQLDISTEDKISENQIVIFDDLERLSKKIEYCDLLGYFNRLFLCKCRIVCLMSSCNFDEGRKKDFDDFKEKVFDWIYVIDKVDNSIFENMFENKSITGLNSVYDMLNLNIRFASKTNLLFSATLKALDDQKIALSDEKKLCLLKASICAVYITFSSKKDSDETPCLLSSEKYEKKIADSIKSLKADKIYKDYFSEEDSEYLLYCLLEAYNKSNYFLLIDYYSKPVVSETDNYILNQEYFYLSDGHKDEFEKELKRIIITEKFEWTSSFEKILANVLHNRVFVLEEEAIMRLAKKASSSDRSKTILDNMRMHLWPDELEDQKIKDNMSDFLLRFSNSIARFKVEKLENEYKQIFESNDYWKKANFLDSLRGKKSIIQNITDNICENNFFLSGIDLDIDESIWHFCHTIAKFAVENDLSNRFIDVCKTYVKEHPSNFSLLERLHALIFYNIDQTFKKEDLLV